MSNEVNMEIEKKFLISELPEDLENYPHKDLEQAYLNRVPVVRIRKGGDKYMMTYKGSGMMAREEYNLPLTEEAYKHLLEKADGHIITKTRYKIPLGELTIELDIFHGDKEGLVMAEVEFPNMESALSFVPPSWFSKEVTEDGHYHNVNMAYD